MFDRHLFSAALKFHMLQHELSLREAAKESGVSPATLSRLANGDAPDIDSFALVTKWLETDANQFLGKLHDERSDNEIWTRLYFCLQELQVSMELIEAIVTILRLVRRDSR